MDNPPAATEPAAPLKPVRLGLLGLTLLVLAVSVFVVYASVLDAIQTWLEWRWVPVARAAFGVAVAGLALWVLQRLTRSRVL